MCNIIIIIIIIIVQILTNKFSKMKTKIILICTLFIHLFNLNAQIGNQFELTNFKNKRIISVLKISEIGTESPDSRGKELSGANRVITRQITIKSDKKNQEDINVERIIKRYQVFSNDKSDKSIYDTDNKFDRDGAMNTVYGSFDGLINETVNYKYNKKGTFLDTLRNLNGNDFQIDGFSLGTVEAYKNYLNFHWTNIFQLSSPQTDWKVGVKFKDYRYNLNSDYLNDYEIEAIVGNKITLSIKGTRMPKNFKIYQKKLNNLDKINMLYNAKNVYQGTIVFNASTRFIEKVVLNNKVFTVGTPKEEMLMTKQIEIDNTIENLKNGK